MAAAIIPTAPIVPKHDQEDRRLEDPALPKKRRTAVGYVRVSTTMQADDGLSLEAQRAAIVSYCSSHDLQLLRTYQDVESGAKSDRAGLRDALASRASVFVVIKFDRISRSLKHFCQLYEDYFAHSMELVAIREAIKLDSALGRALVSILLVFAQMEREATGERTREAIQHINSMGYFFGKVPFGKRAVPASDNPRYRILVPDEEEQKVLAQIKSLFDSGLKASQVAAIMNKQKIAPPQGKVWTSSLVYNLKLRMGWQVAKPDNARNHTDQEVIARMTELWSTGRTYQQVANILNEEGYLPRKGPKFTNEIIRALLRCTKTKALLTPRKFAEQYLASGAEEKPSLAALADLLGRHGYATPRGNKHWWPAQVRELLAGRFDSYYSGKRIGVGA